MAHRRLPALVVLLLASSLTAGAQAVDPARALCRGHEITFGADIQEFSAIGNLNLSPVEQNDMIRLPFIELVGSLRLLGPEAINDFFAAYRRVAGAADDLEGPPAGQLGMASSKAIYIAVPAAGKPFDEGRFFRNATAWSRDELKGWSWTARPDEAARGATIVAVVRADGTMLISNSEEELVRIAGELQRTKEKACSQRDEQLTANPYWIKREKRGNDPVGVDAPFADRGTVDEVTLAIRSSRSADLTLHGSFGSTPAAQVNTGIGTFDLVSPREYILHIPAPGEGLAIPDLWFGVLALMGFGIIL